MKATQKDFKGQAARFAREAGIFFFCGPDEAGVQDAAMQIAALLPDPGERVEPESKRGLPCVSRLRMSRSGPSH